MSDVSPKGFWFDQPITAWPSSLFHTLSINFQETSLPLRLNEYSKLVIYITAGLVAVSLLMQWGYTTYMLIGGLAILVGIVMYWSVMKPSYNKDSNGNQDKTNKADDNMQMKDNDVAEGTNPDKGIYSDEFLAPSHPFKKSHFIKNKRFVRHAVA